MRLFRHLTIYTFLVLSLFVFTPNQTLAATEGTRSVKDCYCFCEGQTGTYFLDAGGNEVKKDEKNGVMDIKDKDKVAPSVCETNCAKHGEGTKVSVCAESFERFPTNNRLCFTKQQCERKNVSGDTLGEWDGDKGSKFQPPECLKGMYYCYPHAKKAVATLSVKIGNVDTVGDFGQYVVVVYQWLLAAGSLIALVMVLIGGLQYALGAGVKSQIEKGRERMTNGIIGLVLLLSVAFIFTVVNPQTLSMQVPRLPLIRTLEIPGADSCEKLIAKKTIVKPEKDGEVKCGNMGLIIKAGDGVDFVPGSTCQYSTCENDASNDRTDFQSCVGFGKKAECTSCAEMTDKSTKGGVKPSTAICRQLAFGTGSYEDGGTFDDRCIWTKDGDFTSEHGIIKADNPGSCVFLQIICGGENGVNECSDYNDSSKLILLNAENNGAALSKLDTNPDCTGSSTPFSSLQSLASSGGCASDSGNTLCNENPCNVELDAGGCAWFSGGVAGNGCHTNK